MVFITQQGSVLYRVGAEAEETVDDLKQMRELCSL
jgi:hypothetical protein